MAMNNDQLNAFLTAKEIAIAKLSSSEPAPSNKMSGAEIGDMFIEIYKAILSVITNPTQQ